MKSVILNLALYFFLEMDFSKNEKVGLIGLLMKNITALDKVRCECIKAFH
jgi:hypothetical protein